MIALEYVMSASKGFSYLVPITVQPALVRILKKLPSTARPIYREWYGDVMASRACAQDSADAMVTFIVESFPKIRADHNQLARLMNEEIDLHEHDYVPVKFPIVAGADEEGDREVEVTPKRRPGPAMTSRSQTKRRKIESSSSAPEGLKPSTSTPKPELHASLSSLSSQSLIADENAMGPTPPPSVPEPANHNEDTSSHNTTDAPVAAYDAPSPTTAAVETDVEHPMVTTKTKVIPEDRDTDDDGYSYYTGAPEPFKESLRPHGAWSTDLDFLQALERWV